jgi:phosphoserine phosphatase
MLQFILVRPGTTDYDLQSRIQGILDIPLCEAGKKEAASTAEALRPYSPKALYCAPCSSAEETAYLVGAALGLKPKSLERLQNVNMGLWQGQLVDEVRHKQPKVYKQWQEHPEGVHPPEGEMLTDVLKRMEEALEKLVKKHREGAVVVVVPEPLATLIQHRLTGKKMGDLWRAANGCGRVEVLQVDPSLKKPESAPQGNGKTPVNGTQNSPKSSAFTMVYRGSVVERP